MGSLFFGLVFLGVGVTIFLKRKDFALDRAEEHPSRFEQLGDLWREDSPRGVIGMAIVFAAIGVILIVGGIVTLVS